MVLQKRGMDSQPRGQTACRDFMGSETSGLRAAGRRRGAGRGCLSGDGHEAAGGEDSGYPSPRNIALSGCGGVAGGA
jgi:hypothetical protein